MKILTIFDKKEEAFLRKKTQLVDFKKVTTKELRALVQDMRKAMKEADGIGLSANQIGIDKKIFVAQVPDGQGHMKFYAICNPEITKASREMTPLEEGCLSVPRKFGTVRRAERLTLEGYEITGKRVKIKAWGILARVFQHEVDHLNGVVFVDRSKDVRDIVLEK